jgi:hypothetical protein
MTTFKTELWIKGGQAGAHHEVRLQPRRRRERFPPGSAQKEALDD